jgi:DNA-binding HxlR family transcriptional regulator
MYDYRDYCPVSKAAQVLCERWTLLIIREMLAGCTRFSQLQRYLPRISPSLLNDRLQLLEENGIIVRKKIPEQRGYEYLLTNAGRELEPVIMALGGWAMHWVYEGMSREELNVEVIMRDVQNDIVVEKLPPGRTVLHFRFTDIASLNEWYLVIEDGKKQLCDEKLMLDVDVYFTCDLKTLAEVWIGDVSLEQAQGSGGMKIVGREPYLRTLRHWIGLSPFAPLERRSHQKRKNSRSHGKN